MPATRHGVIPAVLHKTLLGWIERDDGDTTSHFQPSCNKQTEALHARIIHDGAIGTGQTGEPLQPPSGLRLAPLG